jgi:hypothetical protein
MHITLYDAQIDRGSKGRVTAGELTMDLVKEVNADSQK